MSRQTDADTAYRIAFREWCEGRSTTHPADAFLHIEGRLRERRQLRREAEALRRRADQLERW